MKIRLFVLPLLLFFADFVLKYWVYNYVYETVVVFSTGFGIDFFIQCVTNTGGAWGLFSSYYIPLLIIRIFIIIGLIFYSMFFVKSKRTIYSLTLIIVGAFCNVFDCFFYGHVVDMLHFTFWGRSYGIFNLADAMIFLGGLSIVVQMMQKKGLQQTNEGGAS